MEDRLLKRMAICSVLLLIVFLGVYSVLPRGRISEASQHDVLMESDENNSGKPDNSDKAEIPEEIDKIPYPSAAPIEGEEQENETVPTPVIAVNTENLVTPVPLSTPLPLSEAWTEIRGAGESDIYYDLTSKTIIIEKGEGYERTTLSLEDIPVKRQIRITIRGIDGELIGDEQIKRVSEETYYHGTPPTPTPTPTPLPTPKPGKVTKPTPTPTPIPTLSPEDPYYEWRLDIVKAIETSGLEEEDGSMTQTMLLTLDKTYCYRVYEDQYNYYISLVRPKDVYEKIIVIDAGHGGNDTGAGSADEKYWESDINLAIVLKLKAMLDTREDIKVYYTRTENTRPTLKNRVNLANDLEADFFLSVHCNSNTATYLTGAEALYCAGQNDWNRMNSKRFATICSDSLVRVAGLKSKGIIARDETVTIVKYAEVPMALVEVGYMSNKKDVAELVKEEVQERIAQALYSALDQGYSELREEQRQ